MLCLLGLALVSESEVAQLVAVAFDRVTQEDLDSFVVLWLAGCS